jgi:alpha-1,3-rhamnosyl/mannosyltransferase
MRVAFDTSALFVTKAGTARYINGLLTGFSQLGEGAPDIRQLCWAVDNFEYQQPRRMLKTAYRELVWAGWIAPRQLAAGACDVLHSPAGWFVPPPAGLPHVVTLLDLAIYRHPERFRRWHRVSTQWRSRNLPKADAIITISRFTADEGMKVLGLPAAKFHPILLGCAFTAASPERGPRAMELPEEFFLFIGSLEPGKNLRLLCEVYANAAARGRTLPPLVVVGVRWQGVPQEQKWPPGWIYAGEVADEEMVYLYRRALALVFPSKYEGFGLPPLEAMTLGCPVICSAVASLPEVGGEAAIYVAQTADAYESAMHRLATDQALREDHRRLGLAQAAKFSWRQTAAETVQVYAGVVA